MYDAHCSLSDRQCFCVDSVSSFMCQRVFPQTRQSYKLYSKLLSTGQLEKSIKTFNDASSVCAAVIWSACIVKWLHILWSYTTTY